MHGHQRPETQSDPIPRGRFAETGRFGRMFPHLRSLSRFEPGPAVLGAQELDDGAGGKIPGPMNGGSPGPDDTSQDNPRIRAGYTFLGQFIDHDITFDPSSILERQIDPGGTRNFRTPVLELDSLYGLGPSVQPYLYDASGIRFLLSEDEGDLPRNRLGRALIGDPRNDENTIVSQLHLLFLKFHNRVVDEATDPADPPMKRFEAAQTIVRWHYQWIVLYEFLPRLVDLDRIAHAMTEAPFRFGETPFMPVEFSVAAYRFGHSQVRPGYLLGPVVPGQPPRAAILFPAPGLPAGAPDLRGGKPVPPEKRIEWEVFFGPTAQPSKKIDIRLSESLLGLPTSVIAGEDAMRSLAARNLQRGIDARLPSGQSVAKHLCIPELPEHVIWAGVPGGRGQAPLWFYVLREAEQRQGLMMDGVGAEIVARTFAALLEADKASFPIQEPKWKPWLGATKGRFSMSDLVNFTLKPAKPLGQESLKALPDGRVQTKHAAE
jgi:hypothetical protein